MIMINGNWEQVNDFDDVLRICEENIGSEFAQKAKLIYEAELWGLEDDIITLRHELSECEEGYK